MDWLVDKVGGKVLLVTKKTHSIHTAGGDHMIKTQTNKQSSESTLSMVAYLFLFRGRRKLNLSMHKYNTGDNHSVFGRTVSEGCNLLRLINANSVIFSTTFPSLLFVSKQARGPCFVSRASFRFVLRPVWKTSSVWLRTTRSRWRKRRRTLRRTDTYWKACRR